MLKKLSAAMFMLTCLMAASVSAQTTASADKQAAIKELIALFNLNTNLEETVKAMVPQMQAQQDAALKSLLDTRTDLSAAEKKAFADSYVAGSKLSVERLMNKMMEKLNYNELINEVTYSIYDKHFTLEEIRDMTAFYKTPTGDKLLKSMAPITTDTMLAMQERVMPKMMLVIQELMNEDKAELERQLSARKAQRKKTGGK